MRLVVMFCYFDGLLGTKKTNPISHIHVRLFLINAERIFVLFQKKILIVIRLLVMADKSSFFKSFAIPQVKPDKNASKAIKLHKTM